MMSMVTKFSLIFHKIQIKMNKMNKILHGIKQIIHKSQKKMSKKQIKC